LFSKSENQLVSRSVFGTILRIPAGDLPVFREKLNNIEGHELSMKIGLPDNNTYAEVIISTLQGVHSGYFTFTIRPQQTDRPVIRASAGINPIETEGIDNELSMVIVQKRTDGGVLFSII